MNKIGIHFGYWADDWFDDIPSLINKAANIGFDVFECVTFNMLDLSDSELFNIKTCAEDNNVELSCAIAIPPEFDVSSKDNKIRSDGIEYLKRNLELVYKVGGKVFNGVNYGSWMATLSSDEDDKRPFIERSVKSIKEVVKTAEALDIIFAVEVVNRFEQFMLNNVKESLSFVKDVDSPNIFLNLDTFHMNIEEDNIHDAIVSAGKYLGHFHCCENNRKAPGKGHIPWKEVFNGLSEINYKGYIVIESFVKSKGQVANALRIWSESNDLDLDLDAKIALDFIKNHLN